jgi:hypothetical protein
MGDEYVSNELSSCVNGNFYCGSMRIPNSFNKFYTLQDYLCSKFLNIFVSYVLFIGECELSVQIHNYRLISTPVHTCNLLLHFGHYTFCSSMLLLTPFRIIWFYILKCLGGPPSKHNVLNHDMILVVFSKLADEVYLFHVM